MAAANDLRKGMAIKYNGNTAIVLDVQHRTPGNLRAFVQAIIRYINTGKSADVRFGSTDKIELVDINRTTLEFSYKDNNGYHFMDPETYDTVTLHDDLLGDAKDFLVEPARASTCRCSFRKARRSRSIRAPARIWDARRGSRFSCLSSRAKSRDPVDVSQAVRRSPSTSLGMTALLLSSPHLRQSA